MHGNTAYITPDGSYNIYSYQNILGEGRWFQLPDNPNMNCGLAVIDGLLTSVGGWSKGHRSTLLSLTGEDGRKEWSEIFPPMHTARSRVACVATKQVLVVAGGYGMDSSFLDTVEIMEIDTKLWKIVCPLPQRLASLSATVCADKLYLAGGGTNFSTYSKSVLTCSLTALLKSSDTQGSLGSRIKGAIFPVWKTIRSLPVTRSTLVSFGGQLLAVGGTDDFGKPTSAIYVYNSRWSSWSAASQMMKELSACFALSLPDYLIVTYGTSNVEVFAYDNSLDQSADALLSLTSIYNVADTHKSSFKHDDFSDLERSPSEILVPFPESSYNLTTSFSYLHQKKPSFSEAEPQPGRTGDIHRQGQSRSIEGDKTTIAKYILPKCMTLLFTMFDCTSEGRKFTDEANDFSLEIPEGAIPEGERLTVDVGVALFCPFKFPEGMRPVSPMFWVCVRDNKNFQFSKPVTVTIPHFLDLNIDDDIQSLGLTFLKADHNMDPEGVLKFTQTDGKMNFQPSNKLGFLQTLHFCSLCIACKDKLEIFTKTDFCITSIFPTCALSVETRQYAYFFITFNNLRTCLTKVDELIADKMLENYQRREVKFNFKEITNPSLEMIITQPKHGFIGNEGQTKVNKLVSCN